MSADPSFDVYRLPEEHEAIRAAVRAVCDAKVAPNAAEDDDKVARYAAAQQPEELDGVLPEAGVERVHLAGRGEVLQQRRVQRDQERIARARNGGRDPV